ncbi:MAG TPA: hypothetical protein VIS05_00990 [Ilumatobacter sp.]
MSRKLLVGAFVALVAAIGVAMCAKSGRCRRAGTDEHESAVTGGVRADATEADADVLALLDDDVFAASAAT